jgi:hypothetical protein
VPFIRTNRPEPVTGIVCAPPVPVVVEKIVVNGPVAVAAVWIWNSFRPDWPAVAAARLQCHRLVQGMI